jgi:hypothetical protein
MYLIFELNVILISEEFVIEIEGLIFTNTIMGGPPVGPPAKCHAVWPDCLAVGGGGGEGESGHTKSIRAREFLLLISYRPWNCCAYYNY